MIAFLPFILFGDIKELAILAFFKIFANIFMINGWFIHPEASINRMSWYLTTVVFCFFCFQWWYKKIKSLSAKNCFIVIIVLWFIQLAIAGVFTIVPDFYVGDTIIDSGWIVYFYPLTRVIDFFMGTIVGVLFIYPSPKSKRQWRSNKNYIALLSVIMVIISNALKISYEIKPFWGRRIDVFWSNFSYVSLFSLSSCLVVYVFAYNDTKLTEFCTNRITIYLGNLSPYMYLLHYMILEYLGRIVWRLFGENAYVQYRVPIGIFGGLPLTIVFSVFYLKLKMIFQKRL